MRKFNRRIALALLLAFVAGLSLAAWAGPVLLQPAPKLPDQIRSLAQVQRVRIGIDSIPGAVTKLGITAESIREQWGQTLTDEGYEVVEPDVDAPKVNLRIMYLSDPIVPDAGAYTCVLTVEQAARIGSADEPLHVPTFLTALMGLETEKNLKNSLEKAIRDALRQFIEIQKRAAAAEVA